MSLWNEVEQVKEEVDEFTSGNSYLVDPAKGLKLISNLISRKKESRDAKDRITQTFRELDRMIHYDFLDLCKMEKTPNEAEMFQNMKKALADLEDTAEFPVLANKNVVAVAGGFSAGKSRFINSLLKDELLPTDPNPTTVIPTYIINEDNESLYALNTFKNRVPLDREAIKAISHEFNRAYGVGFSHIIDVMMMESPAFSYKNIAFLDTPGYSNFDTLEKGDNTDEKKALEHLRHVDHLIWVIDISNGTLPESDIAFLKQLNLSRSKPVFIVLNKADLKMDSDIDKIMKVVRERVTRTSIPCAGIVAYSSQCEKHEIKGDSLLKYLKGIDDKQKYAHLHRGFDEVFQEIIVFNKEENERKKKIIKALNFSILKEEDDLSSEELQSLKETARNLRKEVESTASIVQRFSSLRQKMEDRIGIVLKYISVDDEKGQAPGITGEIIVRDQGLLMDLETKRDRKGKVVHIDSFGVYIDADLPDQIMLHSSDVSKHYSHEPEDVFHEGKEYDLKIISIDQVKRLVKIMVMPDKEEINQ